MADRIKKNDKRIMHLSEKFLRLSPKREMIHVYRRTANKVNEVLSKYYSLKEEDLSEKELQDEQVYVIHELEESIKKCSPPKK